MAGYERPKGLTAKNTHYCPGCGHGIAHRLIAEALGEMNCLDKAIIVAPVGCAVLATDYLDIDGIQAAHGRAPATATGLKRARPENLVLAYQGDGDLASIGMAEIIHAAARGEKITIIFINNGIYGMTGGQMAPTTLPGMKTTTSQIGRNVHVQGYPIKVSELISQLDGPVYVERVAVNTPAHVAGAKKAIKKAIQAQLDHRGFSLVEILSGCPINWGKTPVEAMQFVEENVIPYYPLGVYKDLTVEGGDAS
jgi:2-oxoglutarate ferredoxin oxidoreductase subunit beta